MKMHNQKKIMSYSKKQLRYEIQHEFELRVRLGE